MKISSLTSIISAAISAFNDEASPSLYKQKFSLKSEQNHNYLTFYQNSGNAMLCPSVVEGYMTFDMGIVGDQYYPMLTTTPDDIFVTTVTTAQSGVNDIIIGNGNVGNLYFYSYTGVATPYIGGEELGFYYDPNAPESQSDKNCNGLWIGNSTLLEYGWSPITLIINNN